MGKKLSSRTGGGRMGDGMGWGQSNGSWLGVEAQKLGVSVSGWSSAELDNLSLSLCELRQALVGRRAQPPPPTSKHRTAPRPVRHRPSQCLQPCSSGAGSARLNYAMTCDAYPLQLQDLWLRDFWLRDVQLQDVQLQDVQLPRRPTSRPLRTTGTPKSYFVLACSLEDLAPSAVKLVLVC